MIIPERTAFAINRMAGESFPFSYKVSQSGEITSTFVCAQRVLDICDLIEKFARSQLVLFNVEQTSILDEQTDLPVTLAQLAANAEIQFSALDSETLILPKGKLYPLLSTFDHYGLMFIDCENDWDESQVIGNILLVKAHDWKNQRPVLMDLPNSHFFLASHDDCYLTLETRSDSLSKEVFSRTLQLYTDEVLKNNSTNNLNISNFPLGLLDQEWKDNFAFTILESATTAANGKIRIGVSKKPFNLSDPSDYPVNFWIL